MRTSKPKNRLIIAALLSWFERHKRVLPWRDVDLDDLDQKAYLVLVSEIMLQQTQVPRVVILYKNFIQKYPTAAALAKAGNGDVLMAWRGLGYNNRALRLRDAARMISGSLGGQFPRDLDGLMALPGVGHYTAAAIRNFAFSRAEPCLDTNIRRILHRVLVGPETPEGAWSAPDADLLRANAAMIEVLPPARAAALPAILMDLGSAVCTKRSPRCDSCPVKTLCRSAHSVPKPIKGLRKEKLLKEPGRLIAGRFTPNRLVRGRIVEALRDHPAGLNLRQIGPYAASDWDDSQEQKAWLQVILTRLIADQILQQKTGKYRMAR